MAGHTVASGVDVDETGRAHTGLGLSVVDVVGGAGLTLVGVGVPEGRGLADAPAGGVGGGQVLRTDTAAVL